jgi:GntR family transcriptional regulator
MPRTEQSLPKYLQIANAIQDQVLRGDLPAGSEVPSERQLAVDWSVARPTAAKALAELRRLGIVESRVGSGTFVRELNRSPRAEERLAKTQATGTVYGPNEAAVIQAAEVVPAPEHVRDALGLGLDAKAIRRHRVTYAGDEANETSVSWFAAELAERAPALLRRQRIREGTTAYVERSTGRVVATAQDRVCARRATAAEAEVLRLPKGSPVLVTEHLVVDRDGNPVEFAESACPPNRWTPAREYFIRP